MKIAVISRGRTNSTAIGKSLSLKYNLEYFGEKYLNLQKHIMKMDYMYQYKDHDFTFTRFTNKIQKLTNNIFDHNNFVVKIFPQMLHYPPHHMLEDESFDSVKNNFIFDLNVLKIKDYDKIYFLDRNFYHSIVSWLYALKTGKLHRSKEGITEYKEITLENIEFAITKFTIIEYFAQQRIRKFLDDNGISYQFIDEKNCDQYIDLPKLDTEKTNIDYTSLITNIKELDNFIDYWYPICEKNTQDWNFY